ncbi:MAG: hypothetical protein M1830_002175 [Pleopsidium flavum]|nr:MAG: hypothetical protein M1830_002175 [Pleopsidium flavum]
MFAVATKISESGQKRVDHILSLPILQLSNETDLVSLLAIGGRNLYIIPVKQQAGGELRSGGRTCFFSNDEDKDHDNDNGEGEGKGEGELNSIQNYV